VFFTDLYSFMAHAKVSYNAYACLYLFFFQIVVGRTGTTMLTNEAGDVTR
jgi:hypothetical protein